MKFRSLISLLTLLSIQTAFAALDPTARIRLGEEALAAGLWEVAATHFRECLSVKELAPDLKATVNIRLAETLIRDGLPEEAIALLDDTLVSSTSEASFWKAQALVKMGKLSEAIVILNAVTESAAPVHLSEAVFTIANLHLALGQTDEAIAVLKRISDKNDPLAAVRSRLRRAEILLETGRLADARAAIADVGVIPPKEQSLATFIDARLLLAEQRPADAALLFSKLLDKPTDQSPGHYHMAAVGFADSLLATGEQSRAASFLISFIQEHPDSPQLEALFRRLRDAAPATPNASDPTLIKLSEWILPAEFPTTGLIAAADSGVSGAWPHFSKQDEIAAHAMFSRAEILRRVGTADAIAEAKLLLTRLRLEFPQLPLADKALLESSRIAMNEGNLLRAYQMLASLRESAASLKLRGEAAFIEAQSAYASGEVKLAASLFSQAGEALDGDERKAAYFNAAVIRLLDPSGNFKLEETLTANPGLAASLLLEQALVMKDPLAKREAIENFLLKHPSHAREAEARLEAAEVALAIPNPDLSFARAQIDTLLSLADSATMVNPERVDLVRLRLADLSQEPEAAIAIARDMLSRYTDVATTAEASLVLGRNLFESNSYNEARMVLEKLAASDPDPSRAEAAWFLAAKSAALIPTSQSQAEALLLFDNVIALNGVLKPLAMMEKARLMIDMNRLPDAAALLQPWFDSLDKDDPLRLACGFLLGEAIYGQGSNHPESLRQALGVYERLLENHSDQPEVVHRLQYLRGRTLEQLPDADDPSGKRQRDALAAFYSVLETGDTPKEWHYFELCGFRALALLEKAGRWSAAVACARKIASFNGPRAAEAAAHADQLQLKHMIYVD